MNPPESPRPLQNGAAAGRPDSPRIEPSPDHTEEGRAEILLTPGVFLRAGENTSVRMISNRLADTRVELLSGDVIVESNDSAGDKSRETSVTIQYKDSEVGVDRNGIFRFSTDPAALKV